VQYPARIATVEAHVEVEHPWPGVAVNIHGIYLINIPVLFSCFLQEFPPAHRIHLKRYVLYQARFLFLFIPSFSVPGSVESDLLFYKTLWAHIHFSKRWKPLRDR
jgi:hypothetical protein